MFKFSLTNIEPLNVASSSQITTYKAELQYYYITPFAAPGWQCLHCNVQVGHGSMFYMLVYSHNFRSQPVSKGENC